MRVKDIDDSPDCQGALKIANRLFTRGAYRAALAQYEILQTVYPELAHIIEFNIHYARDKINSVDGGRDAHGISLITQELPKRVFVGIASIPQREAILNLTIDSLIHQVDRIGIFLDKYATLPQYLASYGSKLEVVRSEELHTDLGDAGKFYWVEEHDGYYFTCDDDLVYPPDYIERSVKHIDSYAAPVAVGWHGSVILSPFRNYYDKDSRRVFGFGAPRPQPTPVHVLGTGCLAFHTRHLNVKLADFKTPNMADVYFAVIAQQQQVPLIVLPHEKGEINESENSQVVSIFRHSISDLATSRHNTKKQQNEIVSQQDWRINYPDRRLKIWVIGRFLINKKGGVFKSSNLLVNQLSSLNHNVEQICLSNVNDFMRRYLTSVDRPDFCLIYPPDPERPDFGDVISHVSKLADMGVVCAVNFSINMQASRSAWIARKVVELNKAYSRPRIFVAAFSNSTKLLPELAGVQEYLVVIPKTIDPGVLTPRDYHGREGIFLGDLAKLANDRLVFGSALKWIEQIRVRLPHVNIYALKHYHTEKLLANYIKVLPYAEDGLGEVLSRFKLYVCLTPGATFEMIPVEAAMCGTPVIHRPMPQSLSEYLAPAGIEVTSPAELGEMCRLLYDRQDLWEKLSRSSLAFSDALHIDNVVTSIEVGIRKCLYRAGIRDGMEVKGRMDSSS